MRNNRVYMPIGAVDKREDFELYYADGDVFVTVKSDWLSEGSKVDIYNRFGGQMARIRFDPKQVVYYVGVERYEYQLHTYTIFEHYFFKGMLWDIRGSISEPPLDFHNEGTGKIDARIGRVSFRDKGQCYEIKVKDLSKLRTAACCVIAMALKESWLGKSEGEPEDVKAMPAFTRLKRRISLTEKGISFHEILAKKEAEDDEIGANLFRRRLEHHNALKENAVGAVETQTTKEPVQEE